MAVKDKLREGLKTVPSGRTSGTYNSAKMADRGDQEALNTASETTNRGVLIRNDGSVNNLSQENRTDLSVEERHELEIEGSIDGISPETEDEIDILIQERNDYLTDTMAEYLATPVYEAPSRWHPPVEVRDEQTNEVLYIDDGLSCKAPPGSAWADPDPTPENPVEVRDPTTNEVSYIDNGTQCLANESVDRSETPVAVLDDAGQVSYFDNGTECMSPEAVAKQKAEAATIKTDPATGLMTGIGDTPDYTSLTMTDDIIKSVAKSAATTPAASDAPTTAANDEAYDMDTPPAAAAAASASTPDSAPASTSAAAPAAERDFGSTTPAGIETSVPIKSDFSTAAAANDSAYDYDQPSLAATSAAPPQPVAEAKQAAPSFG